MSAANEQLKKADEQSKTAVVKQQEATSALAEIAGHCLVGLVGYVFGKSKGESAQEKENKELKAKLNAQKALNQKLQNALSGIRNAQQSDQQHKQKSSFINPKTGKPLKTIWLD